MSSARPWRGYRKLRLWLHLLVAAVLIAATSPTPALAGAGAWSKLNLDGFRINALAVDPTTPSTIFAGTFGNGIFRSTNGGASWQAVNSGLGNLIVNSLSIDPTNTAIVLAGTGR